MPSLTGRLEPLTVIATRLAAEPREALRWSVLIIGSIVCGALSRHLAGTAPMSGLTAMAAIALAAGISSIAGFAFSAISGAMLFHLLPDPVQIVQIMIICSIANQFAMTWSLRKQVNWSVLRVFLFGGFIGLPVGVWMLLNAGRTAFTAGFGAFLVTYGVWMLLRRPITLRSRHPALEIAAGVLGGITGGALGFPSAAATIWCGAQGWEKSRQRALIQPFILIMQIAALLAIGFARTGRPGIALDLGDLLFIPAALLGTAVGMTLFHCLSDNQFARCVNVLLIVSGVSYVA